MYNSAILSGKLISMVDSIKDFGNSFLGAFGLLLSLVFISEIKRKKIYVAFVILLCILLTWLGVDRTRRDDNRDAATEKGRIDDSITIKKIDSTLKVVSARYNSDTLSFGAFKRELLNKFHIADKNNNPVKVENYNTYIEKAGPVHIGPGK